MCLHRRASVQSLCQSSSEDIGCPILKCAYTFKLQIVQITIRYIGGAYYDLDSKLDRPHMLGEADALLECLRQRLLDENNQAFIVVSEAIEKEQLYLHPPYRNT